MPMFIKKNTQIYFYSDANLNLILKFYVLKNGGFDLIYQLFLLP